MFFVFVWGGIKQTKKETEWWGSAHKTPAKGRFLPPFVQLYSLLAELPCQPCSPVTDCCGHKITSSKLLSQDWSSACKWLACIERTGRLLREGRQVSHFYDSPIRSAEKTRVQG